MSRSIAALVLGACASGLQAQVVPQDLNGNGTADAFLDVANGLLWSRPGVVSPQTYNSAAGAVATLTIEGLSDWQIPSVAQFQALYITQGQVDQAMNAAPFPAYGTWYWTTDAAAGNALQNMAFSPGNGATQAYFRSTPVNVWAVRAVPEPATALLMMLGAVALALWGNGRRLQA